MKRVTVVLAALVACLATAAEARTLDRVKLFGGANTDSTEQCTPWFNVEGASKVYIRLWTNHAAFTGSGAGDPDSTFADSISNFKICLSDSASLQQTVTAFITNTKTQLVAGDSVCTDFVNATGTLGGADTTITGMFMRQVGVNKQLRSTANGSGQVSIIAFGASASYNSVTIVDLSGICAKKYMRIRIQPLLRLTSNTGHAVSPRGNRVNGLKGLRGEALILRSD